MSINKSIARSAGIIGLATLVSRLLGFLRDVVIARLFGVYVYAQAFVIAFKIPNLFRDFLGEGAANAALVPVFSEYAVTRSKEDFWELANIVLNALLVVLMVVTVLGVLCAPVMVRLIAPGFIASPEKLETTVRLTRIIFPYILLVSLAAYAMGLLNSLKHFSVPAFAPCLLNISIIVCALSFGEDIKGLASGVLIGGLLQLGIQVPVLRRKGFRWKAAIRFNHPAVKTIGKLMLPRVLSSSIYQLNNFVDSIFGSLAWIVGEGGVAVLYFSYRLIMFPLGIFSNALSQAILPAFSTQALEDDLSRLKHTLSWGLRSTFFLLVPASVGFMALSATIVTTVFQGGRFDSNSSHLTAYALFFYSIGLFAYGATKILQSCFFSLKDTSTPAKVAAVALVLNVILNSALMFPFKIGGIALATSISGVCTFFLLFAILRKKIGDFKTKEMLFSFLRILAASLCMGAICLFAAQKITFFSSAILYRFLRLGVLLTLGVCSYVVFCFVFRVPELLELWKWLTHRKKNIPA